MKSPILYVNDASEVGGGERNLMLWMQALEQSPWRPIVTCPREGTFSEVLRQANIPVEWVSFPDMRKIKDCARGIRAWWKLNQVVRREGVVMIHANSPPWFPIGYWVAKWNRIPSVVSVQSRLEDRRVRQYLLPQADLLLTVSDSLRALVEKAGVSVGKTKTIYSSVDTNRFTPREDGSLVRGQLGISSQDLVLGCVANVAYYKGHDLLLRAFSKIVEKVPHAHCLIVGRDDSEFAGTMKGLARDLGLSERVHFVGFHDDARPYFEAIDVVVLPSRVEGAPVALLEAMAMEKPLIASAVDGTPEIVKDGVTGILIPMGNWEKLVQAVLALLSDPERRQEMGKAGRQWVTRFSSHIAHETLLDGYRRLLSC